MNRKMTNIIFPELCVWCFTNFVIAIIIIIQLILHGLTRRIVANSNSFQVQYKSDTVFQQRKMWNKLFDVKMSIHSWESDVKMEPRGDNGEEKMCQSDGSQPNWLPVWL